MDPVHDIGCTACHMGSPDGYTYTTAHEGLIRMPSHPDYMEKTCGSCHPEEVSAAARSLHFTLYCKIETIWSAFFPDQEIPAITDLPLEEPPSTEKALVSDVLQKRCFTCHVGSKGEHYAGTFRRTGCAACHMSMKSQGPWNHRFERKVPDRRCLSCHYGNFVGWDYYGRFEKDYDAAFRAPLIRGIHIPRPYGVEWFDMTPDVHRSYGMECAACHPMGPCQDGGKGDTAYTACVVCHQAEASEGVRGPVMNDARIGHREGDRMLVDCQACHAVWSVMDRGRALLRQDNPDFEDWFFLAVQGSSTVEAGVNRTLTPLQGALVEDPEADSPNGRRAVWFQCFAERRWGPVRLAADKGGRLRVVRPLLEISLSYVNPSGDVDFDNLMPDFDDETEAGWVPYTPHTVGPADIFRGMSVRAWLLSRSMAVGREGK
jgi:hypothetical protein